MEESRFKKDEWYRSLAGRSVGEYNLMSFVGAGKIGYVYRATMQAMPTVVRAVKITPNLREGWENELHKVHALSLVDGVVHFHTLHSGYIPNESGGLELFSYTVWDYIAPGENLRDYLRRIRAIDAGFVIAVVERILHVLHGCEENGVTRHGDLHAGNILIGDAGNGPIDDQLQRRIPIYVSDFGYGTTGGPKQPKEDYHGLAGIINEMLPHVDYPKATATHRQMLRDLRTFLTKLLSDGSGPERQPPFELLRVVMDIKRRAQGGDRVARRQSSTAAPVPFSPSAPTTFGQFQVSEMIGDRWEWWRRLFVPTVPARSRILALDIPTVVTGPRGCGKTMLFRRLSERLIVECGEVPEIASERHFVALYVNANDFADAFAAFPPHPTKSDEAALVCYANLCVLSEFLAVQSSRAGKLNEATSDQILDLIEQWLVPDTYSSLLLGEDRLERYRAILEKIKWEFPVSAGKRIFPGQNDLSQLRWLPRFVQQIRQQCTWIADRSVVLFVDDFSTPRVSGSMQRTLNRLFLQRSPDFVSKIATEAWSTFVPDDSSGKQLQDGDDYQLIDMGEESLFLRDSERLLFLDQVLSRRLKADSRIPADCDSLQKLLGHLQLSKTEFARRLRLSLSEADSAADFVSGDTQRRGRSRPKVLYYGDEVFANLWSGDTRTMIQLATEVLDQALQLSGNSHVETRITIPIDRMVQDRAFRNRGGEWLNSNTRNEPTNGPAVEVGIELARRTDPAYKLTGTYGDHLKAVVEAFVAAARHLLLGPMYEMKEGDTLREVPRMAFRIEIVDEFRIEGLAQELYRDLIRYGLFMRDNRGKSVRGTFVPRLYLRRLLLPFATLALSKRDSVPLRCDQFLNMLLRPDDFKRDFSASRSHSAQPSLFADLEATAKSDGDSEYDDLM